MSDREVASSIRQVFGAFWMVRALHRKTIHQRSALVASDSVFGIYFSRHTPLASKFPMLDTAQTRLA